MINKCTYNVDELTEPESHLDREPIRVVADGPDQTVVVGQQIVIQPLRFRVCVAQAAPHAQNSDHQRQHHLRLTPPLEQGEIKVRMAWHSNHRSDTFVGIFEVLNAKIRFGHDRFDRKSVILLYFISTCW